MHRFKHLERHSKPSNTTFMLQRLEATHGINGVVLQWLRSYVEDRAQSVHFHRSISRPRRVICGVPQGSVLGPCYAPSTRRHRHHRSVIWSELPHLLRWKLNWFILFFSLKDTFTDCVHERVSSNQVRLNPSKLVSVMQFTSSNFVVRSISRYDRTTPLLRGRLHWLRVSRHIDFKPGLMVFKALQALAAGYISEKAFQSLTLARSNALDRANRCMTQEGCCF